MVVEEHFALNNEENTQIKSEKKKAKLGSCCPTKV